MIHCRVTRNIKYSRKIFFAYGGNNDRCFSNTGLSSRNIGSCILERKLHNQIINAGRLRFKESDRLEATASEIKARL